MSKPPTIKLGDLILLVVDSLGEVEGRFVIHRHIHSLIESKRVFLDGEPGFREGLYGVYSPRIWAELVKLTALGFLKMRVKRSEREAMLIHSSSRRMGGKWSRT